MAELLDVAIEYQEKMDDDFYVDDQKYFQQENIFDFYWFLMNMEYESTSFQGSAEKEPIRKSEFKTEYQKRKKKFWHFKGKQWQKHKKSHRDQVSFCRLSCNDFYFEDDYGIEDFWKDWCEFDIEDF